jgi:hypothetical protein
MSKIETLGISDYNAKNLMLWRKALGIKEPLIKKSGKIVKRHY